MDSSSLSFVLIVREEKRIWKVNNCVFMKAVNSSINNGLYIKSLFYI